VGGAPALASTLHFDSAKYPPFQNQPGPFPSINVFQQGDDILAIIELPGIDKNNLQIQAKENTIRISGKKSVYYPSWVSVRRREGVWGEFRPTLSLPVQLDPGRGWHSRIVSPQV
jgi:HSP20 family molecular chaperone IbpA